MSVFGVDLGCLNATVAITRNGGVDIVTNEVSKRETSVFVSLTDQERCIGESGLDRYVRNLNNTIACIKHWIGAKETDPDIADEKRFLFCPTMADESGRIMFDVSNGGEPTPLYPEQVLAMFLQKLRSYVNRECTVDKNFPADVRDCVITVPSSYTAEQRRLVQQACEMAGINCMSLLNEGTSAAIDYGIFRGTSLPDKEEGATPVAIVDVGFGKAAVSVIKFWKGNMRVLSRVEDKGAAVREIDFLLYKHFAQEIQNKYKVDISENKRARLRVLQGVSRVKQMLSANLGAPLNIENLMDIDININNFTREEYEKIVEPIATKLKEIATKAIANSGIASADIAAVEMIGGGCRIPIFKRVIEEAFEKPPHFTLNATECVARGAAITAAVFSPKFQVREFVVNDAPLIPLICGYNNPSTENPCTVSFLPEVNEIVTLLGVKDHFPKVLDVPVKRSDAFTFHIFYDENAENAASLCKGNYRVGEWKIGAPSKSGCDGLVKVRVRLLPSGIITIDTAFTHAMVEVEVTEEKKDPENPDKEAEKVVTKKSKKERVDLTVTPVHVLGHTAEAVVKFRKQEDDMHSRDVHILRTKDMKNTLESCIFDNRSRIDKGGMLSDFVTDADRETFLKLANDYENWLYEDGAESTLEEYEKRFATLTAISAPAQARHRIHDDAPYALKQFVERVRAVQQKIATKAASKPAHISEEELSGASAACDEAVKFGESAVAKMQATPKFQEPDFKMASFDIKLREVSDAVNLVLNKPVPKPKKEEPKPAADEQVPPPPPAEAAAEPAPETAGPETKMDLD